MARGCRDCGVCTEPIGVKAFTFWVRLTVWIFISWNIGLFMKRCPRCGHWLWQHRRR